MTKTLFAEVEMVSAGIIQSRWSPIGIIVFLPAVRQWCGYIDAGSRGAEKRLGLWCKAHVSRETRTFLWTAIWTEGILVTWCGSALICWIFSSSSMWLNHFSYVHFSEVGNDMYMGNFNPNMNPIMLDSNQVRRGCHSHYKQQRSSPVFAWGQGPCRNRLPLSEIQFLCAFQDRKWGFKCEARAATNMTGVKSEWLTALVRGKPD